MVNHKRLFRIYREERLIVRRRSGRKPAATTMTRRWQRNLLVRIPGLATVKQMCFSFRVSEPPGTPRFCLVSASAFVMIDRVRTR